MFKKVLILNIIMCIILGYGCFAFADDEVDSVDINGIEKVIETASNASEIPKINSRYAVVFDRKSKAILYGKNEKTKTKMASTTKIMTSLIVIENTNLSNEVEVSRKAAGIGGSKLGLKAGDRITVEDLLYGLMLKSGNDAAVALAEYVGGSISEFATLMNEKANELELFNTHFETPHGLDSEEHYTTPYELAVLADKALNNKVIANIVSTKTYTIKINGKPKTISNTNELLGNLNGVYGVKTGFTNGAGRCLVTSIKRGDLDVICVVLGADTKKIRTADSVKLIEYVFNNFEYVDLGKKINEEFEKWKNVNVEKINIYKGVKNSINIGMEEYNLSRYPIKKETENKINIKISADLTLVAPVYENIILGKVEVEYDGNVIENIRILTKERVEKKKILDYILKITKEYRNYIEQVI